MSIGWILLFVSATTVSVDSPPVVYAEQHFWGNYKKVYKGEAECETALTEFAFKSADGGWSVERKNGKLTAYTKLYKHDNWYITCIEVLDKD